MFLTLLVLLPLGLLGGLGAWYYAPDLDPAVIEQRYALPASRFVEIDGVRFHVVDEGQGPAILLMPGLTSTFLTYEAWAKELARDHRVLRVDLPGHGLTGPDPKKRYAWAAQAGEVWQLLDALGVQRATVVGNSMGGGVAWNMAALAPERVTKLVLIAPVGYPIPGELPFIFKLLANPTAGRIAVRFTPERMFTERLGASYAEASRLDPAFAHAQYELFRRAGNRDALVQSFSSGRIGEPRDKLQAITAPTLVLWGGRDPILPVYQGDRFLEDIPNVRRVIIEDAGHTPQDERPAESLAVFREFLANG